MPGDFGELDLGLGASPLIKEEQLEAIQDAVLEFVKVTKENELYAGGIGLWAFTDCRGLSLDTIYTDYYDDGTYAAYAGEGYPISEDTDFTYLYGATDYLKPVDLVENAAVIECREARQAVFDAIQAYTGLTGTDLLNCVDADPLTLGLTVTVGSASLQAIQDAILGLVTSIAGDLNYALAWDDLAGFQAANGEEKASSYSSWYGDGTYFGGIISSSTYPITKDTDFIYLYGATDFLDISSMDFDSVGGLSGVAAKVRVNGQRQDVLAAIEDYTGLNAGQLLAGIDWQTFAEAEAASAPGGTAATLEPSQLVTCDEPVVIEEGPPCPPPCVGNPNAITPNWINLTENEPFLNAKTCEYSITLNTKYEATSIENLYNDPDYLTEGVVKLLEFYGKKTEPYNQTLEDGSEGAEVDPVQLCVYAGTIKDTYVSTRSLVKMKALIVVPWVTFNSIEELDSPEEMPDKEDYPAFVKIRGVDFLLMSKQVARAMEILAVRQAVWFFNEGGRISEPTLNLKDEAKRIRVFRKELRVLLRENDYKFKKSFGGKKWIDEIEIGFDSDMKVDYITATERGCDNPEKMTKSMSAFKNSEPQNIQRTMYFVSKLPEIWNAVTAVEPIEFGDFLTKYVAFPPIEILVDVLDQDAIWCPDPSALAIEGTDAFNLGDEFAELGKDIMDEIVSLPNAIADRFANDLCATLEGKRKNDVTLDDLGELAKRARDTALREFFAGDINLEKIPEFLTEIGTDPDELWTKILDKLGECGLLSLLEMAFACLFAGLSFDDAMKAMLKAAFEKMDDANFQRIFIGLPPDVQREVFDNIEQDLQDIPPPWDSGYRAGSYSGQGLTVSIDREETPEGEVVFKSSEVVTVSGVPTTVGSTTGVEIDEVAIGKISHSYGNPGSIGTAADNIMDTVTAAYKDAILNMIDNNLIDLDMLMAQLNELPGAEIIARILAQMDCPPFPLFTPPIGDFMKTLELDFCRGHFAITVPIFTADLFLMDIFKLLISVAKELIKDLVVKLIILILKKLLEIIFEALCALLGVIGSALGDLITGGNQFRKAFGDALCEDATDEQIDEALRTMMEATGVGSCTSPDEVPTTEDAAAFSEVVAAVLTNSEVIDLLNGEATSQVKQMISDVTAEQVPSLACMQPSDIEDMFKALGTIVNPDLLEQAQMIANLDTPVCDSICASPSQLAMFNDLRCSMMQSKGLTSEECGEQIEALTERAKQDLADLANILQGGPFQEFPPILGSDPICPDSGDPFAPGGSILPEIPEAMNEIAKQAAKNTFESIDRAHIRDLVGRRGFFDMVLSDSNGAGLKAHTNAVSGLFGQSIAEDVGVFEFYTDNWADDQGANTELPKQWNSDVAGRSAGPGDWSVIPGDIGTGGFPLSVAVLLQKYFLQYNQELTLSDSIKVDTKIDIPKMREASPTAPCRGAPWAGGSASVVDLSGGTYELKEVEYKGFELFYQDYEDEYGFQLKALSAFQDPVTPDWNSTDKTETILRERYEEGDVTSDDIGVEVLRFTVTHGIPDDVQSLLDSLSLSASSPLPNEAFSEYIGGVIESYPGAGDVGSLKAYLMNALPYLQDVYMRKFALLLASNANGAGAGEDEPLPDAFQFGYAEDQEVQQIYMAGDGFVDTNPGGFAEKNGRGTGDDAIAFDEDIYDRFGGNPKSPPYYMENQKRFGWLDMVDKFVPEVDACDPLDGSPPREPICKFEDLKDVYVDLMNKYQDDKRLSAKPGSDCAQDIPFNIALTRGGQAGIDTSIMAVIRIYVIEALLRGTPIFAVFSSECFNEILSSYIVKFIEEDIQYMGVFGLPSKKYYYRFMEQIVQMYGRQVDLGMIDPIPSEQEAMDYLNALQLTFKPPKGLFGKSAFNKARNEMVQEALDHEENTGDPGIRTLLSGLIMKETVSMNQQFEENLYPDGMPVPNLPSLFFGSGAFVQGSLETGVLDVYDGVTPVAAPVTSDPLATGFTETDDGGMLPFRLERYLRVTPLPSPLLRTPTAPGPPGVVSVTPKDVQNLDSFVDWGNIQADADVVLLSELFENVSLGYRLVFTTAPTQVEDEEWTGTAVPLTLRTNLETAVGSIVALENPEKSFIVPSLGGTLYMVPLASSEMDVDPNSDQTLQQFLDDIEGFDEINRSCILDELANTDAYKMLFGICIPFEKMLSWLAIYTINNFLPSVGWIEDGWVKNGGRWQGFSGGFRSWDQKTFEKSKRAAKGIFMQFYNSNDPTYESDEQKAAKKDITRGEKPRSGKDPGLRWFAWRRKVRKPTDKNGYLCP